MSTPYALTADSPAHCSAAPALMPRLRCLIKQKSLRFRKLNSETLSTVQTQQDSQDFDDSSLKTVFTADSTNFSYVQRSKWVSLSFSFISGINQVKPMNYSIPNVDKKNALFINLPETTIKSPARFTRDLNGSLVSVSPNRNI